MGIKKDVQGIFVEEERQGMADCSPTVVGGGV
jgi:hypothetical protein